MKVISWNINGIRAIAKKGFADIVQEINADVVCLQEIKAKPEQIPEMLRLEYPHQFINSAQRPGYSGVAVYSKIEPITVSKGIGHPLDDEGRVITLEFEEYYVVTVYTPNAKDDLSRIPVREKEWDPQFLKHCKKLEENKPVIFCGDLNVAHQPIDLKNDKANKGKKGFTDEERQGFTNFVDAGFIDTFRHFHPDKEQYSWWSYFGGARSRNVGWRIDYVLISPSLIENLESAYILDQVMGSDHCPVGITLKG